ncbi:MAG TPA: elongation factor EF-2 [Candidatus Acidoferrales bacterium]|nr:elongation factor EF-2 [Candidatus Acidoferrales bacterium]
MVERVKTLMDVPENIRNIGIVAHIDHGKTTLTDNLLAGAGMISKELAGTQLFMDFDEEEQARGITINAANVSMVHEFEGEEYLINLIDTPGHVDFGGDVTRAMRAVDGAVVVVDAVEGTMPQTETVLRQALKENVKPILFINKVDRLVNELKLDPQAMMGKFINLINHVNKLIQGMNETKYNEGWKAKVDDGSVAFGSALYNWALSVPQMQKTKITFKDVYEYCAQNNQKELANLSPLHEIVLNMVVSHLPNPLQAQMDRVPVIWHGDKESAEGKAMLTCDQHGPVALMVTDITVDPHAGEIATGRLFSGTLERGLELVISGMPNKNRIQQVGIFMGAERLEVEKIPAGNISAVTGLRDAVVGSTVSSIKGMVPFESIKHSSEPVVTVAIEAKNMKDLPKLVEVLRQVSKEDPTLRISINEETGEHLISGMGELHLEIIAHKIERDKNVEITTSEPIVIYRETVRGHAGPVEGKSPNRHNRFYFEVERLPDDIVALIKDGTLTMNMPETERRAMLVEAGMDKEEAKKIVDIFGSNALIDATKGIQYLRETMELIIEGFHEATRTGPLTREPCEGIKVKLVDVTLHEDAVHRGPAQVIPAVRSAVFAAILMADDVLLEPKQKVFINVPQTLMGNATQQIQGRRGQILDIHSEGDMAIIVGKAPVAEMFGFAGDLRSATEGRAIWSTELAGFEVLTQALQPEVVKQIRQRKGLKAELPKPQDFIA